MRIAASKLSSQMISPQGPGIRPGYYYMRNKGCFFLKILNVLKILKDRAFRRIKAYAAGGKNIRLDNFCSDDGRDERRRRRGNCVCPSFYKSKKCLLSLLWRLRCTLTSSSHERPKILNLFSLCIIARACRWHWFLRRRARIELMYSIKWIVWSPTSRQCTYRRGLPSFPRRRALRSSVYITR